MDILVHRSHDNTAGSNCIYGRVGMFWIISCMIFVRQTPKRVHEKVGCKFVTKLVEELNQSKILERFKWYLNSLKVK